MEASKDYRFKLMYALAMFMVVCGHCEGGGISLISDWFPYGGVHLPIFMFCSGYFYKSSSEDSMGKYILKKIRKLLIPLYVYTVIYGLIVQVSRLGGFSIGEPFTLRNVFLMPIINGNQFVYNLGGWFIAPLFMVQVGNVLFRKILRQLKPDLSEGIFFALNIILGIIGNTLACNGFNSGYWLPLVRALYFVPFYGLGIFYKSTLEKWAIKIPGIWYFAVIFLAKLLLECMLGKMPSFSPAWCNDFTEGSIMPIVTGYLGIAFWFRIAEIVEPVLGRNKYVNLIADNTYSIMMNQFAGFMFVKTIYAVLNKFTPYFYDFDWGKYKSDIWWYYKPWGIGHTLILYSIAGIVIPIVIQLLINRVKGKLMKRI